MSLFQMPKHPFQIKTSVLFQLRFIACIYWQMVKGSDDQCDVFLEKNPNITNNFNHVKWLIN